MPQVIPILPYIAAALSVASAIYASSLATSASTEDVGSDVTKTGTSATRNPVYGKCRCSSVNVYNNVDNDNNANLMSVFGFGIGPMEAIHELFIDDVSAINSGIYKTDPNGSTSQLIFQGNGNFQDQNIEIQIRSGLNTEIPMQLAIDYSDGEWTSAHRGDRCGQVAVKAERNVTDEGARILNPQFAVSVLVSGLKVFDPRNGSDTSVKTFSRNPALCILDYITDTYYGMGIDYKYIDLSTFINTANWCDTNGLYIDAEINSDLDFATILSKMVSTFGGILVAEAGFVKIKYEDVVAPRFNFTEDDIVSDNINVTNQTSGSYYNVVETSYKNRKMEEKEDIYTLPKTISTDPRIAKDGYVKSIKLELPYTLDGTTSNSLPTGAVKFLTNRLYRRSDYQKKITFDIDLEEYPVTIFDVITVTNEHYGWVNKGWRVTAISKSIDDEKLNVATISCDEYNTYIYTGTDDGSSGEPLPPPTPTLSPTNLAFNQATYITSGYGELTWSGRTYSPSIKYHVDYKLSSDAGWTRLGITELELFKVANLRSDTYEFRVRAYHPVKGTSPWTTLTGIVIAPNVILPPVIGIGYNASTEDFIITFDDMLDAAVAVPNTPDSGGVDGTVKSWFSHYNVDIKHWNGTGYDYKATYQTLVPKFDYTFTENLTNGLNRKISVDVYIVAKDGTQSQLGSGSSINCENPQCAAPAGVVHNTELSNTIITWVAPPERDYKTTRFYVSDSPFGGDPNESQFLTESVGTLFSHIWTDLTTKYIKFAHTDSFGTDNAVYSTEIAATPKTIDISLPIDDRFDLIREPLETAEPETVIKASKGDYVAAIGLFADDTTEQTDILIAAENLLMGVGGRPKWVNTTAYVTDDKVLYTRTDGITGLYQATADNTNELPTNTSYWTEVRANVNQSVFATDESGKVLIKNAVIEDLTSDNITARSIVATSLAADTITGNEISSSTTIIAGKVTPPPQYITKTAIAKIDYHQWSLAPYWDRYGFMTEARPSEPNDQLFGAGANLGVTPLNDDIIGLYTDVNPLDPPSAVTVITIGDEGSVRPTLDLIYKGNTYTFNRRHNNNYSHVGSIFSASDVGTEITFQIAENIDQVPVTSIMKVGIDSVNGWYGFTATDGGVVGSGEMSNLEYDGAYIAKFGNQSGVRSQIQFDVAPRGDHEYMAISVDGTLHMASRLTPTVYVFDVVLFTPSDTGSNVNVQILDRPTITPPHSPVSGLNGNDLDPNYSSWRIWSGAALPSNANFRVDRDGKMFCADAEIRGDIYAYNGTFSGDITGSDITGSTVVGNTISGGYIIGVEVYAGSLLFPTEAAINYPSSLFPSGTPAVPISAEQRVTMSQNAGRFTVGHYPYDNVRNPAYATWLPYIPIAACNDGSRVSAHRFRYYDTPANWCTVEFTSYLHAPTSHSDRSSFWVYIRRGGSIIGEIYLPDVFGNNGFPQGTKSGRYHDNGLNVEVFVTGDSDRTGDLGSTNSVHIRLNTFDATVGSLTGFDGVGGNAISFGFQIGRTSGYSASSDVLQQIDLDNSYDPSP